MTDVSDFIDSPLDAGTTADESLNGIERRLDEIGRLMESQLAAQGVTELHNEANYHPTAFEYAAVPTDATHAVGLPSGKSVIDFERGEVSHETAGKLLDIRSFEDMSEGIDTEIQELRSAWLFTDAPCSFRFDEGNWAPLDSCQYTPISDVGFKKIEIKTPPYPVEVFAVASTRSDPFTPGDSVAIHMARKGDFSGTPDSWQTVEWTTPGLYHDYGMQYAAPITHNNSFGVQTYTLRNTGSNDLYVRLQAADSHHSPDWFTVGRRENSDGTLRALPAGEHHTFHVEQRHHLFRAQVQNATNGNAVQTLHSMNAGSK